MSRQENRKGDIFYTATGVVKSYNKETGYGFIFTTEEPDTDIYVHATSVIKTDGVEIKVGDEVEFLYKQFGDKGFRAYGVKIIEQKG